MQVQVPLSTTPTVNSDFQSRLITYSDLIVSAIRIDPPNPNNSAGFDIYATLKNQGSKKAFLARGWHLAYSKLSSSGSYFSGESTNENTTFAPQEAREVHVKKYSYQETPVGTWTVTVRADPDKQIAESDENNNEKSVSLTVTEAPPPQPPKSADLIITNVRFEPAETTVVGNFEIVVTVKNQGTAVAYLDFGPMVWQLEYHFVTEDPNYMVQNFTLQPNETRELRYKPQKLQVGTSAWRFLVNPNGQVQESKWDNNTMTIQVTIK